MAGKPFLVLREVKQILQVLPEGSPVSIDDLGAQARKLFIASWSQRKPHAKLELHTRVFPN